MFWHHMYVNKSLIDWVHEHLTIFGQWHLIKSLQSYNKTMWHFDATSRDTTGRDQAYNGGENCNSVLNPLGIRHKWRSRNSGVIWSYFRTEHSKRAVAFITDWSLSSSWRAAVGQPWQYQWMDDRLQHKTGDQYGEVQRNSSMRFPLCESHQNWHK